MLYSPVAEGLRKREKGTMHGKESNVEVCNMYQGQTVIVFFVSVDSPILFATAYAQSTICSFICVTVLHSTTLVSPGSCSTYEQGAKKVSFTACHFRASCS